MSPTAWRWSFAATSMLALACGGTKGGDLFAGGGSAGATGGSAPTDGGSSSGGAPAGGGSSGGGAPASGGTTASGGAAGETASGGMAGSTTGTGAASGSGGTSGTGGGGCTEPTDEICDGMDNDCSGEVDDVGACPERCYGLALGGHGYMFCDVPSSLAESTEACETQGMRLAWIDDAEENAALVSAIEPLAGPDPSGMQGPGADPGVRIGASDREREGDWRWIGGYAFWEGNQNGMPVGDAYVNWSRNRPNNGGGAGGGEQCAVLLVRDGSDGDAGQWNDVQCTQEQPFVCERP